MKATGIVRNVDSLGRLVLPSEMRERFGVKDGGMLEIFVDDDSIILKKFEPTCLFCGSYDKIRTYKERTLCDKCISELSNLTEK